MSSDREAMQVQLLTHRVEVLKAELRHLRLGFYIPASDEPPDVRVRDALPDCGLQPEFAIWVERNMTALVRLVTTEERERAARIAEDSEGCPLDGNGWNDSYGRGVAAARKDIATKIRGLEPFPRTLT